MLYFPFHVGDWITGTKLMSAIEKGVYMDLLTYYYSVERPITEDECRRIARAYAGAEQVDSRCTADAMLTNNHKPITKNINNTNKQQTEICNEEPVREKEVCSEDFSDSIADQAENLAIDETMKVVDDPEAIVTPIQVVGLAKNHGIRIYRSEKLNAACRRRILTVDNVRQCIRIAKKENKGGQYLVGILANAVNEPNEYHTWEYEQQKRKEWEDGVDENVPF